MKTTMAGWVAAMVLGWSVGAAAQTDAPNGKADTVKTDAKEAATDAAKKKDPPKMKKVVGKDGKVTWVLDRPIDVVGKLQLPRAYYVLQRSRIEDPLPKLERKLAPRILTSVNKNPF